MKKIILIAMVATLGALLWWRGVAEAPATAERQQPPAPVTLYTATVAPLSDRTEALGTLLGNESVTITANTSETIAQLHFEEGQQVDKGQLLVTLSQAEEQAQLASARADLAEQQREVKRLEGLIRTHATAQTELDQRRTAMTKAQHRIEELQAVLADLTLRAPFAGVVGFREVSPGALVTPGTVITTLDDIGLLKLEFSVPETLLGNLSIGQRISAHSAALGRQFEGVITSIDTRVNPVDRSIKARARFDNPARVLKPGMLMVMELHSHEREAISLPEEALTSRGDRHYVWVLDAQANTVAEREVTIGSRRPGWVEITAGLKSGEQVVRTGIGRLRPGAEVKVAQG